MDLNEYLTTKINEFFPVGEQKGDELWIKNPLRPDNSPGSFSINLISGLWKDFADNSSGNMATLIARMKGVTTKELWKEYANALQTDEKKNTKLNNFYFPKLGKPSAVYPYHTIDGKLVGHVCRFETPKGKEIRVHSNGKWNKDGFPKPHPLFNCHKLIPGKKILIVEGEKTALAAQELLCEDYIVLTWIGGTGSVHLSDWSVLQNYSIIYLWPDNDSAGVEAMNFIFQKIFTTERKLNEQLDIKIVDIFALSALHSLPPKWDLGDADKSWTKEKIINILESPSKINQSSEQLIVEVLEKIDEEYLEDENKPIDYKSNTLLKELFCFVSNFKMLDENNVLNVYMGKNGLIIGNSISAAIFFSIDYYKSSNDENASNKLFIASHDGKLLHRQKKKLKDKYVFVTTPIHFNDNTLTKYHDFYNNIFTIEEYRKIKRKLKYNGAAYEYCKKQLQTLLKYSLFEQTESEACAIAIIHFISQVKLKMNGKHEHVLYHSAPVLINNDQGSGKSAFVRALCKCLGTLFVELNIDQITDVTYWKMMSTKAVVFGDDFEKINGKNMATYKSISSSNVMLTRTFRTQNVPTYTHNCTYIFTANTENLGEKIHDETGNRRFMPFLIKTFVDVNMEEEDFEILKPLYKQELPDSVFPIMPFNKTDLSLLWQNVNEEWMFEKWYLDELSKIKPVQKKHMTKTSIEQFLEVYEVEVGEQWIPSAMVYSLYARECKNPETISKFTRIIKSKFGEETCMPRVIDKKCQRAYKIKFNSALEAKFKKEFANVEV